MNDTLKLIPEKEFISLQKETELFDFEKDDALVLVEQLIKTMHKYDGIGLAAPQVGLNLGPNRGLRCVPGSRRKL